MGASAQGIRWPDERIGGLVAAGRLARTTPSDRRPLLKSVDVPTLVVHGTEDPIFPLPHGAALADAIPGAELMTLDGAGHEMPRMYLEEMVARTVALSAEPVS